MSDVTVTVEDDPVPIVMIMAARFRRATAHPEFTRTAKAMRGSIALTSSKDPQTLTIAVHGGAIHLQRGASKAADVTVTVDFDTGDVKRIEGWWRHPLLVWRASKLLAEYACDWQDAAQRFWSAARNLDGMPAGMLVRCTDDGRELSLGDGADVEIEGSTARLRALFDGNSIFVDTIMKRQLRAACSMKHIAVLSSATKRNLLGEL